MIPNTEALKDFTESELVSLLKLIQSELEAKKELEINTKILVIKEIAASMNMQVDIYRADDNTGTKCAPKYVNPDNPAQTWVGRGKTPIWMQKKINEGFKKEDFFIK